MSIDRLGMCNIRNVQHLKSLSHRSELLLTLYCSPKVCLISSLYNTLNMEYLIKKKKKKKPRGNFQEG